MRCLEQTEEQHDRQTYTMHIFFVFYLYCLTETLM